MQEAGLRHYGRKDSYLVFEVSLENFRKTMKNLRGILLDGFNVTVPYKQTVIPYLDGITEKARWIGAVNTVYRKKGKWFGTNTDADGFVRSVMEDGRFRPKGKTVLLLGAGGASRAVSYGLAREGAKRIFVTDVCEEKAEEVASHFRPIFPRTEFVKIDGCQMRLREVLCRTDLVVNATTVGLKPADPAVIPAAWIPRATAKKQIFFYDLIYHPSRTALLCSAARKGHRTSNGLGMLLYQGAAAFECWTGEKAPVPVMRKALEKALNEKEKKHSSKEGK
jgi:shikimate dehydrogenase